MANRDAWPLPSANASRRATTHCIDTDAVRAARMRGSDSGGRAMPNYITVHLWIRPSVRFVRTCGENPDTLRP